MVRPQIISNKCKVEALLGIDTLDISGEPAYYINSAFASDTTSIDEALKNLHLKLEGLANQTGSHVERWK